MITTLNFRHEYDPEVLDTINKLSELEERKPHDSAKRLIVEEGNKRIKELESVRNDSPSLPVNNTSDTA